MIWCTIYRTVAHIGVIVCTWIARLYIYTYKVNVCMLWCRPNNSTYRRDSMYMDRAVIQLYRQSKRVYDMVYDLPNKSTYRRDSMYMDRAVIHLYIQSKRLYAVV